MIDKNKPILILGAKGTLGHALTAEFALAGYKVIGWDKEDVDITAFENLKFKIENLNPGCIINAVAINNVDGIEEDDTLLQLAEQVNGYAPGRCAALAKELGIPFVHYSSDYVFDGEKGEPYLETDAPRPISRYGETKLLGEIEVQKAAGAYYLMRLSRLFGEKGSSEASKRSFVDTMLALAASRDHLEVVSDQVSSPTYAPDLARLTRALLEGDFAPGIYHGTNSGECSWYEWAEEIFRLKNISIDLAKVPATHFPRPAEAPRYSVLKNTKLPEQRSWREALAAYLL